MAHMQISIRETDSRRYIGCEWMNGCLHMHADIHNWFDVQRAQQIADGLGLDLHITDEARAELGPQS